MASGSTLIDTVTLSSAEGVTNALHAGEDAVVMKYSTLLCRCHDGLQEDDEEEPDRESRTRPICGIVAFNCIRLVYQQWADGLRGFELLARMISNGMVNDIMRITYDLPTDKALTVNELLELPIFAETITSSESSPNISSSDDLRSLLSDWFPSTSPDLAAVAFHRHPEIAVCMRIPVAGTAIYAVFDPHPRPNHLLGPAFSLSNNIDHISAFPNQVLLQSGSTGATQEACVYLLQPKPHTLHEVISRASNEPLVRMIDPLRASDYNNMSLVKDDYPTILAECSAQKNQPPPSSLDGKTYPLLRHEDFQMPAAADSNLPLVKHDRPNTLGEALRQQSIRKDQITRSGVMGLDGHAYPLLIHDDFQMPDAKVQHTTVWPRREQSVPMKPPSHADLASSQEAKFDSCRSKEKQKYHAISTRTASSSTMDNKENIPPARIDESGGLITLFLTDEQLEVPIFVETSDSAPDLDEVVPTAGPSSYSEDPQSKRISRQNAIRRFSAERMSASTIVDKDYSWELAMQLQQEEEIASQAAHHVSPDHAWLVIVQKQMLEEEKFRHGAGGSSSSAFSDYRLALQLQQAEAGRDVDLVSFKAAPFSSRSSASLPQPNDSVENVVAIPRPVTSYECGVCNEMFPEASKISLSGCGHAFCQDCLCTFAKTKLEEGRYPIFCPECLIERSRINKSHLTDDVLERLDLTQQERDRMVELQLVAHSVTLECPRCHQSMNVAREEYGEQRVIVCPLPRCGHKWCKSCLRGLASSDDRHRCKNDNIERLMRRKGWKHCPGCRTPVQKESGCNHMTCGAPGCNVHFCYKCGVLIVDTTNGGDVGMTVTEHYNNCRLFEKRFNLCTIQ